ncbi:unnamed protein product [Lathyrus sativus]|nr:unnamed protein product [Lathyrus sativus]
MIGRRKEVMIKSILQDIPSYVTSVFVILDGIVIFIEKMMNSFWWGGSSNNKGIKRLAWDKLSCTKKDGGTWTRRFKSFRLGYGGKTMVALDDKSRVVGG